MFAKTIVLSDAFLDMSLGARCLYMTFGMLADDDGFVNAPKSIMRQCGASEDDFKVLIAKKFIIPFESGVIVIKHWRINNYLQKDRIQPTKYQDELQELMVEKNGAYSKNDADVYTENVYTDKNSIDKDSIGKDSINNNILSGKKSDNEKKNTFSEEISKIINYLNDVLGTRYTTKSKSTNSMIKGRLEEGHTVDDFIKVIDNKHKEWGEDPKMVKYLRPETLFRASHFESYLNEIKPKEADLSKHYYQPPEFVPQTEEEKRRSQEWWDSLEEDEDV